MRENIRQYFATLKGMFDKVIATGVQAKLYQLDEAIDISIGMIAEQAFSGGKLLFIGNGGSAAIASHMAIDFWKNAAIRALAFNDSSLLTCISNDYGYRHVFEKPVEAFAEANDVLIAISSSGRSENILRGTSAAQKKGARIITFSGFDTNNPLRNTGEINFYVPASHYGYVEIVHLSLCHSLVDIIIDNKSRLKKRIKPDE